MTTFSDFNLAGPIEKALAKEGYETPTPIQQQAIPIVLGGADLLGIAQTGTGKTAAFALPVLHHLCKQPNAPEAGAVRALVLAPTRELAGQIAESFRTYGQCLSLRILTVFGGVPIKRQIRDLQRGADILVATPGRLIDLMEQRAVNLSRVEKLVLDEADQMLDMGFIHALKRIAPALPKDRQTLFFSATMPDNVSGLAGQFLDNPQQVSVTPESTTAERVEQNVIFVGQAQKQSLLLLTLQDESIDRALIFTRTKFGADRVVRKLMGSGITAAAIHGNKTQSQRQRALDAFKAGQKRVLVATDIAARGIDIDGVSHVVNFEIPNVPEQYVHRIGRTARAGRQGSAISFVANDERGYLRDIQRQIRMTIPVLEPPEGYVQKAEEITEAAEPVRDDPPPRASQGKKRGKPRFERDGERPRRSARPERERETGGSAGSVHAKRPPRDRSRHEDGREERTDFRREERSEHRPNKRREDRPERRFEGRSEGRRENRSENRWEKRPEQNRENRREHRGDYRPEQEGDRRGEKRFEKRGERRFEGRSEGKGDFRSRPNREDRPQQRRDRGPRREGDRDGEGRFSEAGERPNRRFDKPFKARGDRDRQGEERSSRGPRSDGWKKPQGDRDRPRRSEGPRGDRPRSDRPRNDRPRGEGRDGESRSFDRSSGDAPVRRPRVGKPSGGKSGAGKFKAGFGKPSGAKLGGRKPAGQRPGANRTRSRQPAN